MNRKKKLRQEVLYDLKGSYFKNKNLYLVTYHHYSHL